MDQPENPPPPPPPPPPPEEAAEKAATKRYETLLTIRTKAIKGKGAWYWAHLEPFLLLSEETGRPKAVKLRCSLCNSTFSASNPSRTSTDHLKKGSCPNFSSSSSSVLPISSAPPHQNVGKKRSLKSPETAAAQPPATPAPSPLPLMLTSSQHVGLSGGKEDLGALAMLEDSVKRLKTPVASSPGPPLPKAQADAAVSLLADWALESCGTVSLGSLNHHKFGEFLRRVGLRDFNPKQLLGAVLDSRYREAVADSDAKIRDSTFFQLSSSGWKKQDNAGGEERKFVYFSANLPNGTTVFLRALLTIASAPSDYAEEILKDMIVENKCVGIVSDRFRSKALVRLEDRNHWMVNLSCQVQAIAGLIKDFARELTIFETVVVNCFKIVGYFNGNAQVRTIFHRYQLQEGECVQLLRAPVDVEDAMSNFGPAFSMLEDVIGSVRTFQLAVRDEEYKVLCREDRLAVELAEMIEDVRFLGDVQAVHSIVKLIKDMTSEMEVERPLVGQCLPLWIELRSKVSDWCNKFGVEFGPVGKIIEARFEKNYHPAWAAAFILDPIYLIKDASGKYLPPFGLLTPEQEKDVDKLITRLVTGEEAHVALMELMKWRTEGLDPLYAQAVQMKKPDPATGKMRIAHPQSSRLVWETCLSEYKTLGKVAVRIIFLHATASCGLSSKPPVLQLVSGHRRSRTAMERAQKMVSIAAHAKFERRDFSSEEKEAGFLDESLMEAPSV